MIKIQAFLKYLEHLEIIKKYSIQMQFLPHVP